MSRIEQLTKVQHKVFLHLASGLSVAETAVRLDRSLKSVDSHKYRLMRILEVSDRFDLALLALRHGLIDADPVAVSDKSPDILTDRQRDVLALVAEGFRVREIAEALDISFRSAEGHKSKAMHRLGIHDRIGVLYYAVQRGLIRPVTLEKKNSATDAINDDVGAETQES